MKKLFGGLGLCMIVLLVVGVFATAADFDSDASGKIEKAVKDNSEEGVGEKAMGYVQEFVKKKGIAPEKIKKVDKVNFEDLPKEVNIENVDDTNLEIYQIDYDEQNSEDKKVFVVTYSVDKLKAQGDLIVAHDKRQFLQFGSSEEMSDGFLKTATGVEGSLEKGYVMVRSGSITAVSTNLEVIEEGRENIEIIVYKNGERIGFGNSIKAQVGIGKDYDVQSNGVVTFEPGDVISAYAESDGARFSDVITMVEITTTN